MINHKEGKGNRDDEVKRKKFKGWGKTRVVH